MDLILFYFVPTQVVAGVEGNAKATFDFIMLIILAR